MPRLSMNRAFITIAELIATNDIEGLANVDYAIIEVRNWMSDLEIVLQSTDLSETEKYDAKYDHDSLRKALKVLVALSDVVKSPDDLSPLAEYLVYHVNDTDENHDHDDENDAAENHVPDNIADVMQQIECEAA